MRGRCGAVVEGGQVAALPPRHRRQEVPEAAVAPRVLPVAVQKRPRLDAASLADTDRKTHAAKLLPSRHPQQHQRQPQQQQPCDSRMHLRQDQLRKQRREEVGRAAHPRGRLGWEQHQGVDRSRRLELRRAPVHRSPTSPPAPGPAQRCRSSECASWAAMGHPGPSRNPSAASSRHRTKRVLPPLAGPAQLAQAPSVQTTAPTLMQLLLLPPPPERHHHHQRRQRQLQPTLRRRALAKQAQ
mmetsp:Transcript_136016/g.434219  ORF Transcript_136016/g.434219 Transcript_136016/m.434219 type:complete len:241 (+) Transcript_136016:114-836(+)